MFNEAKSFMEDCLKAFGVNASPEIIETAGEGVEYRCEEGRCFIALGSDTDAKNVPLADCMVAAGKALLQQCGSEIVTLQFGPECDENDSYRRAAEDISYIVELAAIYQCYLQNPVEAYCSYDDAMRSDDKASLNRMAVALGLSHPRGLEAIGFDRKEHGDVFEEAEFFKGVITQKRPDLSLLVALQNAWQKHFGVSVKITVEKSALRFAKA